MARFENSKKDGKKIKKKRALVDEYEDTEYEETQLERSRVLPEVVSQHENDIVQSTENENNNQPPQEKIKKKRGPTTMNKVSRGLVEKMQVSFNSNGQPFSTNSEKFVSYLGALVRQHIPIVIEWKNLEEENWKSLKDDMWSLVQQSFVVNNIHKGFIFRMMGKYWRQYKSKITTKLIEANELSNRTRAFQLLKPLNVKSSKDWDTFVKSRLTASFREKREKFKEMRKKQKITHTMSRKGYARLENEMKEHHPNPSEITRVELWQKAYQKKNGEPVNEAVREIMEKIKKCNESKDDPPVKDSIGDDALA